MIAESVIICRCCSAISIALGFFLLGMVLVEDTMPASLLDVVLSPEELKDPDLVVKTQKMLRKAQGSRWLFWGLSGYTSVLTGVVGLWATMAKHSKSKSLIAEINEGMNP